MLLTDPPPICDAAVEYCIVSRRNNSLQSHQRWLIFALLCTLSFGIALVFTALGAWLVLPYSAIEMAVLFWAFRYFERHASDWERLVVAGDRVVIEAQRNGARTRREFNRFWLRFELRQEGMLRTPHLRLSFAGRELEFGVELPVPERLAVAKTLKGMLASRR